MNQSRDPDAIVAAWLEDGPVDLPDDTRRAISVALRTQPRVRRMAFPGGMIMLPLNRLATAAAVVAVVGLVSVFVLSNRGGGGAGGPQPSALLPSTSPSLVSTSPRPSVTSLVPSSEPAVSLDVATWTKGFTSRYGYTISHPSGWDATLATRDWVLATDKDQPQSPGVDHFIDPTAAYQIGMFSWAVSLPAKTTEDEWIATFYAGSPQGCGTSSADIRTITVDSHPARVVVNDPCDDAEAFVLIGRRVYVFAIWRGQQEALLEAFLSTVKFQTVSPSPS